MRVSKSELAKLGAMLESYKNERGTIAMSSEPTQNTWGCGSFCTNTCNFNCLSWCEGSRCNCWKAWKGNGSYR